MKKFKYEKYNYPCENKIDVNFGKDYVIKSARIENDVLIIDYLYRFSPRVGKIEISINELTKSNEEI